MQFAQPFMFNGFWIVAGLVLFLWWAAGHRRRQLQKFVSAKLLPDIAGSFSPAARNLKYVLLTLTFIFGIIALARPQWGFEWQEVKRQGIDVMVIVDVSKSMLTQDVRPNRLERTKLAVLDLLKKLKGDRIGLVAFAGDAFLMCPLTNDYAGFALSLDDLTIDSVPRGGTNIDRAMQVAMKSFDEIDSQYKAIIIITDGDNHEGDPVEQARRAKKNGIRVYTIGIGTKEGELIQLSDVQGSARFLKDDEGNFVKSRLNERLLQQIALLTDGVYVKSSGAEFGLDYIYENDLAKLEKREIESKMQKRFYERFQWPLSVALLLFCMESCIFTRRKK
ncbi:MAG: VWA domain-containing protein [Candidatus Omnitrophica bacterium]|nr:VWA domain-containing protein [Candidatus Omnitrophota bacterium]MCB9721248.1 VWA domain-containing protein [Candidatus Omnitrophota bacterium]